MQKPFQIFVANSVSCRESFHLHEAALTLFIYKFPSTVAYPAKIRDRQLRD